MDTPSFAPFLQLLGRRRKQLGLNQAEVANLLGMSRASLSLLERGKGNPTLDTLTRLADVLGLEVKLTLKQTKQLLEP
jgi:transcriptional regulator with XRE-family HTH domain